MASPKHSIAEFIEDAKTLVASKEPLEAKKKAIGERLSQLSKVKGLRELGQNMGPSDASTGAYLLWREPPYTVLMMGQWDKGFRSVVHEHRNFWVVGCGYQGHDRWDMYERLDDGSKPGHAEVKLVDQWEVMPGTSIWMPPPPRATHSHNNLAEGETLELIFSSEKPPEPHERVVYDLENKTCHPSGYNFKPAYTGDYYPPRATQRTSLLSRAATHLLRSPLLTRQPSFCPVCMSFI